MLLEDLRRHDNSAERLYHKDFGFPTNASLPPGFSPVIRLRYGGHARQEAMIDRYGDLKLPDVIDIRKGDLFEVGVTGNTVTKMAVRMPYDDRIDLIIVFKPRDGFVKTVWANEKNDKHRTLNRSRYIDPKRERQAA